MSFLEKNLDCETVTYVPRHLGSYKNSREKLAEIDLEMQDIKE